MAYGQGLGHRRYTIAGDSGRVIPGLTFADQVARWSPDGRSLLVGRVTSLTVDRVDLGTGRREPIATIDAGRWSGFTTIIYVTVADDLRVYSYAASLYTSQLFTVDGVK